jgi:2-isopropylmalate synthase
MDATRAEPEFTAEVLQIAIDEGATTINIPDTVGYTDARRVQALPRPALRADPRPARRGAQRALPRRPGLAVANSIAGVEAGARQIECAVNGLGERAGNASLEELIMLLHTRRDAYGFRPARSPPRSHARRGWSRA